MVFKRHKILVTILITLVLAAAITAAIFITTGEREGSYKGTLVWSNNQEVKS